MIVEEEESLLSDERTHRMAEVYDNLVDLFAEWQPSPQFREVFSRTVLQLVKTYGKISKKPRILDVGCGHGTWIEYVLRNVPEKSNLTIKGFDISKERIRLAKTILADFPNVSLEVEDAKYYSTSERYDIVFFAEVINLFSKDCYFDIIRKYSGMLDNGGHMVIIDKEKYSLHCLKTYIKRKLGMLHRAYDFTRYPSFKQLSKIAQTNGLRAVELLKVKEFRGLILVKAS